jgi:hypothetical protein
MRSRLLRRPYIPLALLFAVMLISGPVFAQPAPAQSGALQARIDAAALALRYRIEVFYDVDIDHPP